MQFRMKRVLVHAVECVKGSSKPMKIVIRGGTVLPMTTGHPVLEDTAVFIDGETIVGLGKQGNAFPLNEATETIDAQDSLIIPGLINAHTHTPMTLMRSLRDDRGSFMQPNATPMMPPEQDWSRMLTSEDYYWASRLAIAEMIRGGITTFVDMFGNMNLVAEAVLETGIRAVLGWEIVTVRNDPNVWLPYDEETARRTYEASGQFAADWHGKGDGRIQAVIAPHETGTCHEPWLSRSAALAETLGVGISIHVAETPWEVNFCREKYNMSPAQLLEATGILGRSVLGAHSLYLTDDDHALLAQYDYHPISCPQSNLKLAKPMTRVADMLEAGLNVALGTDSVLTNNNLDLWEEMRIMALMQKHMSGNPATLPGLSAFELATVGGARAIKQENKLGTIEVGKKADLVLVSTRRPHWHPWEGVVAGNLLYAGAAADVQTVLVNGRVIMRDWEIVAFDEGEVISEVDRRVHALRAGVR